MREIKFRVWDKRYNGYLGNINKITLHVLNELSEDMVIQQFTGLKDKNNKEIFEGDIIKVSELDNNQNPGPGKRKILQTFDKAIVVYQNGCFYYSIVRKNAPPICHQLLFYGYEPQIIGNIYENPELLTQNLSVGK